MNSQFLFEKLEASDEYKKFMKENRGAYLCSAFFIIDMDKNPENKYHFDFYVPENKKTFTFELENGIKLVPTERTDEIILDKVSMKNHFDFDELKELTLNEMAANKVTNKIQKMIFSLQNRDDGDVLFGTIFLSGLGLIRMNFDLEKNKVTDFEKKSLFDMMKIVKKGDKK
ncbi:Uncharacterised protein [uncultured archaeon]|nr:Uncharacterised protein [uncultured archaeon]